MSGAHDLHSFWLQLEERKMKHWPGLLCCLWTSMKHLPWAVLVWQKMARKWLKKAAKICNRRPLVGAVGAYKRGDARRKDSDLCFAHSRVLCTFTCASHIHLCSTHSLVSHSLVLRTFTGAFSLEARFLVSVRISLFFVVIMGRSANPIRWLVKLKWKFFGNKTTKKVPKKCPFQLKMSKNIVCSPWWRLMTLSTKKRTKFRTISI